ncbi:hypothetical protein ACT3TI_10690 [Psychrobacter sp. AOP22-C1-22]|uniref:hypothetical protein n=1 Tax=unclassified Psychrobacter TaxID=196806 RepID=UPI00178780A6|nr:MULTISPECIES: hypothetical protein [unclassified Psychrobacter]MBE0407375.1 hypothetical protein [Psychrobacter sp. FME6]MBE0444644.1 hypothetical protein [Psychrobacter sp. FME5]MDN5801928.1 hypothetical protein [Psychrobacter sp.]MDN5891652.1 hypothetical protein [Psychrobacter sp.]
MKHLFQSWRLCLSLLGLSATVALAGCNNIQSVNTPDMPPMHTTEYNQQISSDNPFTKCPPYNPEQTMCTMQYDPVCVKIKNRSGISYRTAGNACSACGTTVAIGYVKGQCAQPDVNVS